MTFSINRSETVLAQVQLYADLGLHILPVFGIIGGLCTCGDTTCRHPGKHPLFSNGVYSATNDKDWLVSFYQEHPEANIAIACGRVSGLIFLDLDTQEAIDAARVQGIPQTWKFTTGKGEQHGFKYPALREEFYIQSNVGIAPGMDIRSDSGYSVVPDSNHYSGKTYRWVNPPDTTALAEIPMWLMDRLIIKNRTATSEIRPDEHAEIHEKGQRNEYLFKVGTSLRASRLSGEEIRLVLHERNTRSCSPPLDSKEVDDIVDSIIQRYAPGIANEVLDQVREKLGEIDKLPAILLSAPLTDSGNAECLVELFSQDFKSCKAMTRIKSESRGLFHWNDHIWEEDIRREFRTCALWTARGRKAISAHAETVEIRKRLYKFSNDSENIGKLEAMCELASTNSAVAVTEELWDADPLKLSVANGTLNLKDGTFDEPSREDYITKQSLVIYDEDAACPVWEKTLSEIFRDNVELVPYLQRVFGYALTGMTDQHIMWFWYGDGANGKSTILNTIHALLGDLADTTSFSTFDARNDSGRNDDLAKLRGMRFVAASEGEAGRTIAESKIKLIASSDEITCRFLHNNFFTYKPTYKVILASNHLPDIKGTDHGIWRRVHLVPFNQKFEGEAIDPDLDEKLQGELSGILNWCLSGLTDFWTRGGFDPPPIVLYSTQTLETKSDLFQQWFDERLSPWKGDMLRRSTAYLDYRTYLRTSGETPISKMAWNNRMEVSGIAFLKKVRGDYAAEGWRLDSDLY